MGFFKDIAVDIEQELFEGTAVPQIAAKLNLSVPQVEAYIRELEQADRDPVELVAYED